MLVLKLSGIQNLLFIFAVLKFAFFKIFRITKLKIFIQILELEWRKVDPCIAAQIRFSKKNFA